MTASQPKPGSLARQPRETSGARSSNRFAFQKNWTFCELLKLHRMGVPYVVVCEYHDDVVVLDATEPTRADFYQVKSSDSRWTLNRMIGRAKGKAGLAGSILGKMYRHRIEHGALAASTNFVSNACYNIPLASGDPCPERRQVGVHEFADAECTRAQTAVQTEHELSAAPDFQQTTWFWVTDLGTSGHETYARGKLSEFLAEQQRDFNVGATYRVLFDEIVRKTDREGTFPTVAAAVEEKGITRAQVEALLTVSSSLPEVYRSGWLFAANRLNHENAPMGHVLQLQHAYTRYFAERMDEANDALQTLRDAIRARVSVLAPASVTLTGLLETIAAEFTSDLFPRSYVQAIAIMEMAHESSSLQEARPQPPEPAS